MKRIPSNWTHRRTGELPDLSHQLLLFMPLSKPVLKPGPGAVGRRRRACYPHAPGTGPAFGRPASGGPAFGRPALVGLDFVGLDPCYPLSCEDTGAAPLFPNVPAILPTDHFLTTDLHSIDDST